MARVGVQLKGMTDLIRAVNRYQGLRPVLEKAVFTEANTVLNESKKIVPVATGNLRASGRVEPPKSTDTETVVDVTYGGAAAPYAIYVHEIPHYRHAAGKTFKFLEIPAMAHRDKFARNVKERVLAYLRRTR
jgi:hypothetical protein